MTNTVDAAAAAFIKEQEAYPFSKEFKDYPTPPRAPRRGGARAGAGRPSSVGAKVRSYTLDDGAAAAIAAWQAARECSSASEALRQMIDTAARVARGDTHPCPGCGGPMKSWRPGATCQPCRNAKGGAASKGKPKTRRRVQTSARA